MTEGQLRFQTLMEDQRHNLAMENYGEMNATAALSQAQSARQRTALEAERQPAEINLLQQQAKASASKAFRDEAGVAKDITGAISDAVRVWGTFASLFA